MDLKKDYIIYVSKNYAAVHKWAVELNGDWANGNYYDAGYKAAAYAHNVLILVKDAYEISTGNKIDGKKRNNQKSISNWEFNQ